MKITKEQLKQMVKEEMDKMITVSIEEDPEDPKPTVGGIEGYYAMKSWKRRQSTKAISKIQKSIEKAKEEGASEEELDRLNKELSSAKAKQEMASYVGD